MTTKRRQNEDETTTVPHDNDTPRQRYPTTTVPNDDSIIDFAVFVSSITRCLFPTVRGDWIQYAETESSTQWLSPVRGPILRGTISRGSIF